MYDDEPPTMKVAHIVTTRLHHTLPSGHAGLKVALGNFLLYNLADQNMIDWEVAW